MHRSRPREPVGRLRRILSNDILRLTFDNDHDGTGRLQADAAANGFAARGAAYFNISELEDFSRALLMYPLPPYPGLRIAGGFYSECDPPVLEHELLFIEVYAVESRGQVGVRVHGETEIWQGVRPESRHDATLELLTTYERISEFSRELAALLTGARHEAFLSVERLS